MVVGVLACCALLHNMCDLKVAQMNKKSSLIWELMLYEFKFWQKHHRSNQKYLFYERWRDNWS